MHFTTLYLLKGEELDNLNASIIEADFGMRYCYCCGETRPMYQWWCDWFQIGGRWAEPIIAKKGLLGERSFFNREEKRLPDHYAIAEIKDITAPLDENCIYAIATKSRIYQKGDKKFDTLLSKINNKTINGVVAFIDCHD